MNTRDWLQLVQTFGLPVVMLLVAMWAGKRRMWVWGSFLEDCERRAVKSEEKAARWERMALRGTTLAETGADVAAQIVELAKKAGG